MDANTVEVNTAPSGFPSPVRREARAGIALLKSIDDSFLKFVITEDAVRRYQDDYGVVFMNILEFLLDETVYRYNL